MKVFEVLEQTNEGFLSNLVGDVRNAFKPGIAVTPNMIAELEDGLASLQRGEQPTPRQQKMMDTFMSTTLARELKKTFNVDIEEGNMPNAADQPRDPRIIRNMPNAGDRPRDPRVIRNMPNAAADDVNPVKDYINALKDPNADPEWLEVLRKMANAYTGQDIDDATNEGLSDWFKKADNPQDMQQDVVPMVKQLLDQGMSEQEVVATVEQELGVRPRYIQQAIQMVRAGLTEEAAFMNMNMGEIESKLAEAGRDLGLTGIYLATWRRLANDLFVKIVVRQYEASNVQEGRLKSKSYRKSYKAAKASGRRRMKHLRDSQENNAAKGAAMLSNIDMALDGSGLKRQGFELVKDTNSFTRGSITREAEAAIRNSLAKANALLGGVEPEDPRPTMSKAELAKQEFGEGMYETATSGGTSAGAIATVSNPSVTRNVKKPKKNKNGTAQNAQDSNANLMTGQVIKR